MNPHIKILDKKEEETPDMSESAPNKRPVSKSKILTEELQSENCATDDPTNRAL